MSVPEDHPDLYHSAKPIEWALNNAEHRAQIQKWLDDIVPGLSPEQVLRNNVRFDPEAPFYAMPSLVFGMKKVPRRINDEVCSYVYHSVEPADNLGHFGYNGAASWFIPPTLSYPHYQHRKVTVGIRDAIRVWAEDKTYAVEAVEFIRHLKSFKPDGFTTALDVYIQDRKQWNAASSLAYRVQDKITVRVFENYTSGTYQIKRVPEQLTFNYGSDE